MKKAATVLALAGVMIGGLVWGKQTILAYRGDPAVTGPNYSSERHEAMEEAFTNNDYQAWKELMGDRGRVTQVINETNFARFAEAHRLAEAGDKDGAKQIFQELGLGLGLGKGMGGRGGRGGAGCMGQG